MIILESPFEFEWDEGNKDKNLQKHKVTNEESEEVFFDPSKKLLKDLLHSATEIRYILLGKTRKRRLLFIAFIIRKKKIRIISSRDINKEEKYLYGKEKN